MRTDIRQKDALRLEPCKYGLSKLPFRGPIRPTQGRFVACLGGSDTFAKYIRKPYPDLIETATGEVCVNLGCQSAGPDVFLHDMAIQSLCHDAAATVIQVVGAANLSNAFYKVHPRRNDRFVAPTQKLTALFPEIDFAEIAFTGHLIECLRSMDNVRFDLVKQHLQRMWLRRMITLTGQCSGPVLLLWLRSPSTTGEPAFVTSGMLAALKGHVARVVEVDAHTGETEGMCFAPLDALNAALTFGADVHVKAAKALRAPLMRCLD